MVHLTNETLSLVVRTPQDVLLRADVLTVSGVNDTGPFDILPHHANFISLIKDKITIRHTDKTTQVLDVQTGIIHVEDNVVRVYLEQQIPT